MIRICTLAKLDSVDMWAGKQMTVNDYSVAEGTLVQRWCALCEPAAPPRPRHAKG